MKVELANIRNDYKKKSLSKNDVLADPVAQFEQWFQEAKLAEQSEINAMHLSTVSSDGKPSGRIVLLKGIKQNAFLFYTNYESKKSKDLLHTPYASLTFFWHNLERQVRIEGMVTKVSSAESDNYFASRPRESQLGAWASSQSLDIKDRSVLEKNFEGFQQKFEGKAIPRPPFWGGFKLSPDKIEFWQGRANRLHDRIVFNLTATQQWQIDRLSP